MSDFIKVNFKSRSEILVRKEDVILRKSEDGCGEAMKFFFVHRDTLTSDAPWVEITRTEYNRLCEELGGTLAPARDAFATMEERRPAPGAKIEVKLSPPYPYDLREGIYIESIIYNPDHTYRCTICAVEGEIGFLSISSENAESISWRYV